MSIGAGASGARGLGSLRPVLLLQGTVPAAGGHLRVKATFQVGVLSHCVVNTSSSCLEPSLGAQKRC